MIITDILKETFFSLSANKARSGLTILGIVIGIASVIVMVSIGQGAQASIENSIQAIGSNLIVVRPGAQRNGGISSGAGSAESLTDADVTAIQKTVSGIKAIEADDSKRYQVTAYGTNTNTQIVGTVPEYTLVRNITIDTGTFLTDYHQKSLAKVAVLGSTTRDDLFGIGVNPVGQKIRIKGIEFDVIGLAQSKGGSGFSNPDDAIYIPLSTSRHYLSGNSFVSSIGIAAESQAAMPVVQEAVTALLLNRHGIADMSAADFSIVNQTDIIATASSITGTLTLLLASIAGISLLVGGIGIMNMMLTTVTERTREIGLRKAVGIRKRYIKMQFLIEAAVLTCIGGIFGVALGWFASALVSKFSALTTQVSLSSVLLAFGVSAAVGIVFGFYPAQRAANLSPMEALRYE